MLGRRDVPEDVVEHVERAVLGQQRERLAELEGVLTVVDLLLASARTRSMPVTSTTSA